MKSDRKFSGWENVFKRNQGTSTLGCLFFLIVIGAVGYVGVKIGEACWDYLEVRQKVREALNWAVARPAKSDAEILEKVVSFVRQTGLELKPRDAKITHSGEDLTIAVAWKREVEFPSYTLPLNFTVSLTEIKRWTRGPLVVK
jgi:hypothetical protein